MISFGNLFEFEEVPYPQIAHKDTPGPKVPEPPQIIPITQQKVAQNEEPRYPSTFNYLNTPQGRERADRLASAFK